MKKTVIVYGVLGGVLIAALKAVEYRFLVVEHSLEIYGGMVAVLFSALGALANGESGAAIARRKAEMDEFAETHRNPAINAAITFVEPLPVALIVALVSAGVLSRRTKDPAEKDATMAGAASLS